MDDRDVRPSDPPAAEDEFERHRDEILEAYLRRINAGEQIDRGEVRRLHPEFADDLIEGIEILEAIETAPRASSLTPAGLGSLGDFRLRRRVGRGGMGVVYDAWQEPLDRRVALKVLPAGAAADARALTRFLREAKVAARLHHPNVVAVHGMGVEADTPYYAMEFVEGETLAQILARARAAAGDESLEGSRKGLASISGCFREDVDESTGLPDAARRDAGDRVETPSGDLRAPPPPSRLGPEDVDLQYCLNVARAFAGAAEGLQHAHARGIIHRDLKPSNLILDREGRLRILDFGLARLRGETTLTGSGDLLGTPLYMSPEQAMARRTPVDHRTDIYSLGATLHEMLILRPPFRGKDHRDTISQILSRDPTPLRRTNPRIPRDLETIVLKCLRKDPSDRYATAEALAQDLRRFARGDAIEARPQTVLEQLARRAWRLRLRIALGATVVLAAGAVGILAWKIRAEGSARAEIEYERLVVEALESLPLDRMEDFPDRGAIGEEQREGRALIASFRILDEKRLAEQVGEASEELSRAVRLVPGRPEARYYLVRALRLRGADARATAELERLLLRHPGFAPARGLRADPAEAPPARGAAGVTSGGSMGRWGDAWLAAARAAASSDWQRAEEAWSEVLEAAGDGEPFLGASLEVLLGRGVARLEGGQIEGAKRDLHAASLRWPRAVLPALLLGKAYIAAGQPAEADSWLAAKHAGLAGPGQRDAFALQALQMLELADAREFLLPWADRLAPGRAREIARMHALLWSERLEEGRSAPMVIRIGEALLKEDPRDAMVHALVAVASASVVGESSRRDEHVKQARALGEGDPHVMTLVASLSSGTTAVELCRRAMAIDPGFTPAKFLLAEELLDAQEPEEALPILEEMVRRNREPARARLLLGHSYYLSHRTTKALEQYREALRIGPDWSLAHMRIAQVHWTRGEHEEVERIYLSQMKERPERWLQLLLASLYYDDMGRPRDAIDLLCRSLPRYPAPPAAYHWILANILLLAGDETANGDYLDGFVVAFEPQVVEWAESPWVLESMALALAHAPGRADLPRALYLAEKAVEETGGNDARFLAGLAAVQRAAGEEGKAIRTLEKASSREFFDKVHLDLLERTRRSLWPRVASIASVDAAVEEGNDENRLEAARVDPELSSEGESAVAEVEAYLDACRLQAAGRFAAAADRFARIVATAGDVVRPTARRVACLRAQARFEEAVAVLERALGGEGGADRRLWDLWWVVKTLDLGLTADALPAERPETAGLPGHRDDLRWLVERLAANAPLRIDCGLDEEHADPGGNVWARDRFFVGGWKQTGQSKETNPLLQLQEDTGEFRGEIGGAAYDRPFRSARHFPRLLPDSGYRIPLPVGRYRVALHFADLRFPHPGRRRFDVVLEGQKVLSDCAPNQVGFATADVRVFTVDVTEGFLDLRLRGIALTWREPFISALEVQRAE